MQGDQYNYSFKTTNGQPGANGNYRSQPRTIAELEQWYRDRNLPPYETTRFFIGINYTGKRAFGIYQEGDTFVVYKNKDDGSRAIRYRGPDEAYAVNELFLKLKSEIMARKNPGSASRGSASYGAPQSRSTQINIGSGRLGNKIKNMGNGKIALIVGGFIYLMAVLPTIMKYKINLFMWLLIIPTVIFFILKSKALANSKLGSEDARKKIKVGYFSYLIAVSLIWVVLAFTSKNPHYYRYNDDVYCKYQGNYYRYSDAVDDYLFVIKSNVPREIRSNSASYEYDDYYSYDPTYSFTDSDYYERNFTRSDSDDFFSSSSYSTTGSNSDYDWNSGSNWNSGGTNWSSNW